MHGGLRQKTARSEASQDNHPCGGFQQGSILGLLLFFIFINDVTKCLNQFKYILYADDSTLSTCAPGDHVMDSAELINSELKCFNRWLVTSVTKYLVTLTKNCILPIMLLKFL